MSWSLDFISEEDFTKHAQATIEKHGEKLESYDVKRFNKNIIDPIKLIFDKTVYQTSWEEMVGNEIFRQRDKSNNNMLGFNSYLGFAGLMGNENFLERIYTYAKGLGRP